MSVRRRLAALSSELTVNATRVWALEVASSDRRSIATRSCTVNPAGAAMAAVPAANTREMTRPRRMRRISLGQAGRPVRGLYRVRYAQRFGVAGGRVRSMSVRAGSWRSAGRALVATGLLAGAVVLQACGGGSAPAGPAAPPPAAVDAV